MTTLRRALPLALVAALLLVHVPVPTTGAQTSHDLRVTILSPGTNATFGWIAAVSVLVENEAPLFDLEIWMDDRLESGWSLVQSELDGDGTVARLRFNTTDLEPGTHSLQVVARNVLGGSARSETVEVTVVDQPLPVVQVERAAFLGDKLLVEGSVMSPIRAPVTLFVSTPYGWASQQVGSRFSIKVPLADAEEGLATGSIHASDGRGHNATLEFSFEVAPPVVLFDGVFDGPVLGTFRVPAGAVGEVTVCQGQERCDTIQRIGGAVVVTAGEDVCFAESQLRWSGPCGFDAAGAAEGTVSGHTLLPTRVTVVAYV